MKTKKEMLLKTLAKMPDELVNKMYAISLYITASNNVKISMQGHYDSDVVRGFYGRTTIKPNGFVELDFDENIKIIMT